MSGKLLYLPIVGGLLALSSCINNSEHHLSEVPALLPYPAEVSFGDTIYYQDKEGEVPTISIDSSVGRESYRLESDAKGVRIVAGDSLGLRYAMQTLQQLSNSNGRVSANIVDYPRFEYRGVMLDESRHFMGKEFVKRLLGQMAQYKFNRFHWHLVDAAGWRIELECCPELTEKTAYRSKSDWNEWWIQKDRRYVSKDTPDAYGGYYTKEDLLEVVAYADSLGIVIIPEIEMPGHSEEVLYAFPELSCSGKALPSESDFCVGNPKSFEFLQNVLDEVLTIFPSHYIHIGGDEASKVAWRTCPKCKALMRKEGMQSVDELQSYMIHKMEVYLNSKGRSIIGWDEILQGGLAPNATVMSWRGVEGGKVAADAKHDVIMSPNSHFYLDYYQENPLTAKHKAIGGYLPLKRVYAYEPVPDSFTDNQKAHIKGVQANLWTEYINTTEEAERMLFPRVLALAEIAWSPSEVKDWDSFRTRVNKHVAYLKSEGWKPYELDNNITFEMNVDTLKKQIMIYLDAEREPVELRYRLDGKMPSSEDARYDSQNPIVVSDSARLVVAMYDGAKQLGTPMTLPVDYHKAIGKKIKWEKAFDGKYPAGGYDTALTDGYRGSVTYLDGRWLGNSASLITSGVLDLGEVQNVSKVTTRCMHDRDPWVYMPEWVKLSTSVDGIHYDQVERILSKTDQNSIRLEMEDFTFYPNRTARFIRITYKTPGANQYLFTDELVVW